jgi:hypothetical protein
VTFEEARTRSNISLIAPDANNPVHYTRLTKLGFFPQSTGAGANAYKHYYIFNPPAVTSPGSTPFTLGPETHKAIEAYVVAMGLMKDGRTNEAAEWFKKFYSTIGGLV